MLGIFSQNTHHKSSGNEHQLHSSDLNEPSEEQLDERSSSSIAFISSVDGAEQDSRQSEKNKYQRQAKLTMRSCSVTAKDSMTSLQPGSSFQAVQNNSEATSSNGSIGETGNPEQAESQNSKDQTMYVLNKKKDGQTTAISCFTLNYQQKKTYNDGSLKLYVKGKKNDKCETLQSISFRDIL